MYFRKKEERMTTKYVEQLLLSSFRTSYMTGKVQEYRKVSWGKIYIRTKRAIFVINGICTINMHTLNILKDRKSVV